ncbi:MAG: sulfatase-like hydrolase/transferase [Verrucomicrobia bacterium]|nr:sulfatase-like hydrolase/transferase [Verrucomicrobiota bacterium]
MNRLDTLTSSSDLKSDIAVNAPRRSRYSLVMFYFFSLLCVWTLLRVVLMVQFHTAPLTPGDFIRVLFGGLHRDLFVALLYALLMLVWFLFVPQRWFARQWHRVLFWSMCFLTIFIQIFMLAVEYGFFEEFRSRFNTVAVDYVLYPSEVFVNIWDSYPVVWITAACAVLTAAWMRMAMRRHRTMWEVDVSAGRRLAWIFAAGLGAAALAATINFKGANVGTDRTLNEVSNNGAISFGCAAMTHHLDFAQFYKTIPMDEAYARVRRMLSGGNAEFTEDGRSIRRRVTGDSSRPRLNVVMLLEESLGSEFWGCLGSTNGLTPEMDRLALTQGLLFTNLYASGNRTVRGMEGVLSSFPPLPGDSIVKRDRSDNVETIARVLKRDGYSTLFLYGGRGVFDGLKSFTTRNGYDRFIEQKDFLKPEFTTIWGVCDEEIFARAITEFRELNQQGKPFLGTVLSVSNHKPYTYPKGRIRENPDDRKRNHAVKYSDYALGKFFEAAMKEDFWTNTIFAVVADHGARVYGSQSIPIHSYEIPLVILGPAVVSAPQKRGTLGGSLDVTPTLLGLMGRPYESLFFGRDLLNSDEKNSRAVLNHNRDIGQFAGERLAVLGLKQNVELYAGNPKVAEIKPVSSPGSEDEELVKDTIALYQVADDLYVNRNFRVDAQQEGGKQSSR